MAKCRFTKLLLNIKLEQTDLFVYILEIYKISSMSVYGYKYICV